MTSAIFDPVQVGPLQLQSRVAMAPMTRAHSPGGVPGEDVAAYYARRAAGGVGLIITEGTWIPHPTASNDDHVPQMYGKDALAGWSRVIDAVHAAGAPIIIQLWHVGQYEQPAVPGVYEANRQQGTLGPSGMIGGHGIPLSCRGRTASLAELDEVIDAYATAACNAQGAGADGVEIHGGHGYLLDQFLWTETNRRTDRYGGLRPIDRARLAAEVIRETRHRVGSDFALGFRFSQWKQQNYQARIADTPGELEELLRPIADAGVDYFHSSQRRFWEGEFGSDLNLAGWVKKLTGRASISVGSVTLQRTLQETIDGNASSTNMATLKSLNTMLENGDFDVIAIGRALIANPDWPQKILEGDELTPYTPELLNSLR
jgi:2,4-dienoyl-CoA reductase-like NADH-dependent reductase (Old Yellow Enzyme family)